LAEKGKGPGCASRAPSTNSITTNTSKHLTVSSSPIKAFSSPADSRPTPIENDFDYFRRFPNAQIRNRLAFEGEFSAADLAEGGGLDCYVRAIVERIPGRPLRRARWLLFVRGGSA
jgi:hypothetical protein